MRKSDFEHVFVKFDKKHDLQAYSKGAAILNLLAILYSIHSYSLLALNYSTTHAARFVKYTADKRRDIKK